MFEEYYGKGYYLGAESCDAREMLKNGTLSIGFIGLWDAMAVLKGQTMDSASTMKEYYAEAIAIIRHMREYTDKITKEVPLTFVTTLVLHPMIPIVSAGNNALAVLSQLK